MKIIKYDLIALALGLILGQIIYQFVKQDWHDGFNTIFDMLFALLCVYLMLKYETMPIIFSRVELHLSNIEKILNKNDSNPFVTVLGRPITEHNKQDISLMWDDYHGFIVGRFNCLTQEWVIDIPYAFEFGSKEFEINPVLFWPLPDVPKHIKNYDITTKE